MLFANIPYKMGICKHINAYYAKNNILPLHILEVNEMDMLIEFAKIGIFFCGGGDVGGDKTIIL